MKPPPEDDLKDMFVRLDPPPGGLTRLRARLDAPAPARWPWWLVGAGLAAAAPLLALSLRTAELPSAAPAPVVAAAPAPVPAAAPVDLIAGRTDLHPAWIGLGRLAPPSEPLQLAPELAGALASRRVALPRQDVVFYMLDAKGHAP
ncbi:hypothetical protein SAMN02745121_03859 [Nannocystis exedens]|uniref:Uncharacterized protein n=1 Tax=Nannocystis exedens TaxID=54 RepID=A0A1I1ZMR2_9BACT|nr:hypothetical protein [Nannocystis exedens]PCC75414.1 hypothetical protein NAEX_08524 [Nannocystis exedens]SFE32971.1 hypothetical protein SAMN02745121_03859 [Nannocystis exedens]